MLKIDKFSFDTKDDLFISAQKQFEKLATDKSLGFTQSYCRDYWSSCQSWGAKISFKYDLLVVLGMGGSSLGAQSLVKALAPLKGEREKSIFFLNDSDPLLWQQCLKLAEKNINNTHWLIISKSGGTLETLSFVNLMESHGEIPIDGDHVTVVTEPQKNPLRLWAEKRSLSLWDHPIDVGGRFSVFTPVGLLPAAYCGLDLEELRQGVAWACEQKIMVSEIAAQYKMSFLREEYISVMWPYSSFMGAFCDWWAQLWAESLGKEKTVSGERAPRVSTPLTLLGARDQHSLLQQISEGHPDKWVHFLQIEPFSFQSKDFMRQNHFEELNCLNQKTLAEVYKTQLIATSTSLSERGKSQWSLKMDGLSEWNMGALMMLWQWVVPVIGYDLGIDPFDQPGVERGKRITQSLLCDN